MEIIDGFYYQNVAFMNDKIRLFAEYWMWIYSNCCLQRDYVMELLKDNKPEDVKVIGMCFSRLFHQQNATAVVLRHYRGPMN